MNKVRLLGFDHYPDWASYPRDGTETVYVTRDSYFPDEEEANGDVAPDRYVTQYRGCFVEFTPSGASPGAWEVSCVNRHGREQWAVSTAIWGSLSRIKEGQILRFSHAIEEARNVYQTGEEA